MAESNEITPVTYKNLSGRSGVRYFGFNPETNSINVQFRNGKMYGYSVADNSPSVVNNMKGLAKDGVRLNRFINYNKPAFKRGGS